MIDNFCNITNYQNLQQCGLYPLLVTKNIDKNSINKCLQRVDKIINFLIFPLESVSKQQELPTNLPYSVLANLIAVNKLSEIHTIREIIARKNSHCYLYFNNDRLNFYASVLCSNIF